MTNEQYLFISYFVTGAICLIIALATYALFRRCFTDLSHAQASTLLGNILRRLFFPGIVLPAMAGFFSVCFRSCSKKTYQDIVADRYYLISKNQEQLSSALFYIVAALLIWGFLVLINIILRLNQENRR